jgi:hypothetical protein
LDYFSYREQLFCLFVPFPGWYISWFCIEEEPVPHAEVGFVEAVCEKVDSLIDEFDTPERGRRGEC